MARRAQTRWLLIALLLGAALVSLWLLSQSERAPRTHPPSHTAVTPDDAQRASGVAPTKTAPQPSALRPVLAAEPAQGCAPHASRACDAGDVYWLDGCGARQDKAEECGARLCQAGACEPLDEVACAGWPLQGKCDGDVVRGCIEGWPFERNCAELGKRCVMGDEGAACRKPSEDDCARFGALPRCVQQQLWSCVDGKRVVRDCAAMNARCETVRQTGVDACVLTRELASAPRDHDPCGPCGCPDGEASFDDEQCNGKDDDGDTWIDEDVRCDPLEVMAYVITDSDGRSSYTRQDIELEIANVDALFSAGNGGLHMHVVLAGVIELARPTYLTLDDAELPALRREVSQSANATLRVPVVFTDQLSDEDVPRAGLSTLPNGTCGGIRRTLAPQPIQGVVVVGKRRATMTVAHEIGHFLGLCHTHEADPQAIVHMAHWREGRDRSYASTCVAACAIEGDGICDTPRDPGPDTCDYDTRCDVHCTSGETPSTRNVMSYYTDCRDQLTPEQTIELRRTRELLTGWYRCAALGACPCTPLSSTCPEQMSCRPFGQGGSCTLDGALEEGERCSTHGECGASLICIDQRCSQWTTP